MAKMSTIRVVTRMTNPSRLRLLTSSNLRLSSSSGESSGDTLSIVCKKRKNRRILPPEQVKDKRYNQADDETGHKRKIKGKALSFDQNITGKLAQPRDLRCQRDNNSK